MNAQTDQELLQAYAGSHSETAFAELVRRHIDLVYSAALRMVCDSHLAEDVTQGVFVALAQNARQLTQHPVLSGWLHRTTQNLAANAVRTNVRRQTREQEAVVMNELLSAESEANWENIAPHLDAALGELSEPDRDALLLRYFERKSAREMAQLLGVSDEAAQKRVTRAVERLREFFAKRGVTVGASGLAVVISANAVQAAPAGLALTISTAAALTGATLATTATVTATKAIAMTTLQKTIVTTTIAILAGVAIYEARQTSQLRAQVQTFQQQQAPLAAQLQQLQQERDAATNRLAWQTEELARANSNKNELLRLRGDIGVLRQQLRNTSAPPAPRTGNDGASPNPSAIIFESVLIDDQRHRINNSSAGIVSVTIPAAAEKVEINYNSPGSDSPLFGHFAFQLRGFESDWMDAGTNCMARYEKLPVGRYPFTVKLVDTNGMEIGTATLNLTVSQQARSVQISQSRPANRSVTNNPAVSSKRLVNEFIGTLLGVDAQAQTVTVASGSPQRANLDEGKTYFLTPETKLFKGQLPTTLADGIIGQEVRYGFRTNREENKYQLTVLRFMPEAKESAN